MLRTYAILCAVLLYPSDTLRILKLLYEKYSF